MGPTSFEFVVQDGDKGFSKVTQTKIRRQAMKAVAAARRQTERYGKHNLRQHTITYSKADSELSPTAVPVGTRDCDKRVVAHKKNRSRETGSDEDHCPKGEVSVTHPATDESVTAAFNKLKSSMFFSKLEFFVMEYNVQPADLSNLSSIHIAPVASQVLATQPAHLKYLLSSRQWSYFEYLYSRFGHSTCLDDSIRCLMMVAHHLLAPSPRTSTRAILAQYGAALKSLQKAVDDTHSWKDPDTLCAVNMLQIFSVLYPAAGSAHTWSQHLSGCMRLMELKGPRDFKTDYEKALLISIGGTVTTEAFHQNQVCFLEEPKWQDALFACKLESDLFSDRSPLAIDLAALIVKLPGACKRIGDVVCGLDSSPDAIDAVRQEVRQLRKEVRLWRNRFDTELIIDLPSSAVSKSDKYKRLDALGNALVFEVILARLMGSVQVSERFLMEDEIKEAGRYIAKIGESCVRQDYRTAFYLKQKYTVAAALLQTSHLWRARCLSSDLIEAWKFRQWCDAVPRLSPLG